MHRQLYKYSHKAKLSKQAAVQFQVVQDDAAALKTSYQKQELWGGNIVISGKIQDLNF